MSYEYFAKTINFYVNKKKICDVNIHYPSEYYNILFMARKTGKEIKDNF